ncbi:DUF2059 domain-containing protein [Ruegeria sp. HKCCA5426]|uniref:DUF2059 domain-containing protein n=1 Tax=Ruegeria sp. HKCCA5426 TaxID=2682985 RepID=UPI0014897A97|nr:DUF2059 domain-containing protein [Ruegeria sp. HKCCA5426]
MRFLTTLFVAVLWITPLSAAEKVDRLMEALRLSEVVDILTSEGKAQAHTMNETFMGNSGGEYFHTQIEDIYNPDWIHDQISMAFLETLTDSQLDRAIVFFESDLGQTIVSLENSARLAIQDETIKEMAQDSYFAIDRSSQSYRLIDEYIEVNDLIEKNVQSSLNADYNFFRALTEDAGGDGTDLIEQLLLDKDNIERETVTWLYSFLLLAYQPLTEAQMRENIAFSRTDTGRAMNDAFFLGFNRMYDDVYYRLGLAVSHVLSGSDL